jgi:hypothetical protein
MMKERFVTPAVMACILALPVAAGAQTSVPGTSNALSPASSGRAIDTPRARHWIQIDPDEDVRAYELAPRSSKDDERVEAFLQRHPSIRDRESKE